VPVSDYLTESMKLDRPLHHNTRLNSIQLF